MRTPSMDAWVTRLLGITLSVAGASGSRRWTRSAARLQLRAATSAARRVAFVSVEGRARRKQARAQLDGPIGKLMARREGNGAAALKRIAGRGLTALIGRLGTRLVVSLMNVRDAKPDHGHPPLVPAAS